MLGGDVLLQMSRAASNVMIVVVSLSLSPGSTFISKHFVLFDCIFRSLLLQLIVRASAQALRAIWGAP